MYASTELSPRGAVPLANAIRPCFLSRAQEEEFDLIVWQVRANLWNCGVDHAWLNARSLAGLSHDPAAIMRCALADFEAEKAQRVAAGRSLL
jgi:hypothetical protein